MKTLIHAIFLIVLASSCVAGKRTFVVCEGDSLTAGSKASGPAFYYPAQMQVGGVTVDNIGDGGQQISAITAATETIASLTADGTSRQVVVIWMGVNDLFGDRRTAQQIKDDLATYIANVRSSFPDAKVVGCTITRSTNTADQAADRTDVNNWIKNTGDYDAVVDLELDSRLIDPTDLTYYDADEIHMNDTGYGVVADLVEVAVNGLNWGGSVTVSGTLTVGP